MKSYIYLLLLALCHCHPKELPKDTLSIALDSEVKSLDPRKATDANSMRVIDLIFSGLVKIGPKLQILPDSAQKWEQKDLNYIFYLKPFKFSNGRKVTKEDISFSFQEFMKKGSPFFSAFTNIKSIKVSKGKKNLIIEVKMKKFSATFLSSDLPVIKILPLKEIKKSEKIFSANPIGTGSFKVIHKNSRELLLERVIHQSNRPKYLSFKFIRDSFTRTQKMLTGQIDIAPSVIPLDKIDQFQKDRFQVLAQPSLSTTYLLLNLKNNLLKQKEIRKALQLSINRKEIIKYKLKNYGIPALSLIQPKNTFFNNQLKPIPYNLDKSRQIIKKLNLQNKQLTLTTTNSQDTLIKVKVLASQMNQSGLKIHIESYEWGTFYKDLNQGNYEMALMKWVGVTDPDIYRIAFHSQNQAPQGRNRSFYKNQRVDQLLEQGLTLKNSPARKKVYDQIQKYIAEDIAIIPLWHDMEVSIIKNNVKNYFIPMNGNFSALRETIK